MPTATLGTVVVNRCCHLSYPLLEPSSVVEEEPKPPANESYQRYDRHPYKRQDPHVYTAAHENEADRKRNGREQQSNMSSKLLSPPHADNNTTTPEKRQ